ncbi:MAG: DUF4214 domain-containing protein [Pseudomonadota bacterium]
MHETLHHSPVIEALSEQKFSAIIGDAGVSLSMQQYEYGLALTEHTIIAEIVSKAINDYPDLITINGARWAGYYDRKLTSFLKDIGIVDVNIPDVLSNIVEEIRVAPRVLEAIVEGSSHRDNGSVEYWSNGLAFGRTNPDSYYSDDFLDGYGTISEDGIARASLGGHVRALGDWLGLDGQFGIQGSFSKDGEGRQNDSNSGADDRNGIGNWGGDRDGDGIPNVLDFNDGVGWADRGENGGGNSTGGRNDDRNRPGNWGGDRDGDGVPNAVDFNDGVGWADRSSNNSNNNGGGRDGGKPLILDLDDDGIDLTELSQSTVFMDADGDGLLNRTAWAGDGDGVLFFDADGDDTISEKREYVFTEWDPTATSDIEAVRSVFDSNDDGEFDANDDAWSQFKVLVTNANGSRETKSLTELGITSIDLTADATNIELPDGSIITGKTTFTKSDGTTGTVADTLLVSEAVSYRIEESETTDGNGVRTHIQTGYGADGTISFVITSVTTANGSSITNSYDDNGDGIVDRIQKIIRVTNPDGSKAETVMNKAGAVFATAILVSQVATSTSADGLVITIERDSTGGGWFDQREVRTTHADDSTTVLIEDLDPNGNLIRSSSETVSADGLTRTDSIDEDGDSNVDLLVSHVIVEAADNSRTETVEHRNGDGSLRSKFTESVSADGKTKIITRDLDGDGDTDTQEDLDITVNADSTTTSVLTVKNGDGSTRSAVTHTQSDDALSKTSASDLDGDGDVDVTTVEATTINADGSRETVTTQTNTDSTIRAKNKVTLGTDQVSSETWQDLNQDGTFQAHELSRSVTVDGATGEKTATSWTRNLDGSFSFQSVAVTTQDGLTTTTAIDADGDGDTDTHISDVTIENADGTSTRTVTETSQSSALISKQVSTTSADGLTSTTLTDIDGDGIDDRTDISATVLEADGGTTQTQSSYAGDGTTLLSETVTSQSADRRLTVSIVDANGDGATDTTLRSEIKSDGSREALETRFSADASVRYTEQTDVSADGLTNTTATDLDGDGDIDIATEQNTVLNTDGSRTTTTALRNGDSSLRSQTVSSVSDDGLVTTTTNDADGDGVSERKITLATVLNTDGSRTTTEDVQSSDGSLLSRSESTINDDGLVLTTRSDADGDQDFDLSTTSLTVLNADGGRILTTEVKDTTGASEVLRSRVVTTTSDDGRDVLDQKDINGDGNVDMRVHSVIGDDGHVTVTESELNSDGTLQSRMVRQTSDTGLESSNMYDADGDGSYERSMDSIAVLNADGSTTQTVEEKAEDGSIYRRTVTETSRDGWTTTIREDWDNDGDDDLTSTQVYDLSAAGEETTTITRTAADGSLLSTDVTEISADGRSSARFVDADGDGVNDMVSTTAIANNGSVANQELYYEDDGSLLASRTTEVSADGLTVTSRTDRNADSAAELIAIETTVLEPDGGRSITTEFKDGSDVRLAQTIATIGDDGFSGVSSIDLDGDGTHEFVTSSLTSFAANGDVTESSTTIDATGTLLSSQNATTSGDGLNTTTQIDTDGDGSADRTIARIIEANGAWTQVASLFAADGSLIQHTTVSESADSWTRTTLVDEDGDGNTDKDLTITIGLDRSTNTVWKDLNNDGTAAHTITGSESANGMESDYAFDLDGDGAEEFVRISNTLFDTSGNLIATIEETHADRLTFSQVITDSADGLTQTVETDIDGDGDVDVTQVSTSILNDDGSQDTSVIANYSDGTSKSSFDQNTSADGRTFVESLDFDGDGNIDFRTVSETEADGSFRQVEKSFDADGDQINKRVIEVTADGLITTISTDDTSLEVRVSAIGNGSYQAIYNSDALDYTSIHHVDAARIETWSLSQTLDGVQTDFEARLTSEMKSRVIAEAERLYDTLLDRDLDRSEVETLIAHVQDGELDIVSLATALMQSEEFAARFPSITDASFVNQTFVNAFGRGASFDEFESALEDLSSGTLSRSEFVAEISESSEHLVVGNGHMSTNNFDVFLNPARAERNTDKAYISAAVVNLVAILYSKELSDVAHSLLVAQAHAGIESTSSLANQLADETSNIIPDASLNLSGMSDSEFVTHVLTNAFGNTPTPAEVAKWSDFLSNDEMSRGEFALMVARSTDYATSGSQIVPTPSVVTIEAPASSNYTVGSSTVDVVVGDDRNNTIDGSGSSRNLELYGNDGDDVLSGGSGSDFIYGGLGADEVRGNAGDDYLFIDTADLTSGTVLGGTGFDTAQVLDSLAFSMVMIDHSIEAVHSGGGDDDIRGTGYSAGIFISGGAGDDVIKGGDGSDYLLGDDGNDDIFGDAGNDVIYGGAGDDEIDGDAGDDIVYGGSGEDRIYGWTGADLLDGGSGVDLADYWWSTSAVTVNLATGIGAGGHAEGDTLVNIEDVDGSDYNDTLIGDAEKNHLFGDSGNDTLRGGAGNDTLDGDDGDDSAYGEDGDDTIYGWSGADLLDGGAGTDLADYWWSSSGVTVNLATGLGSGGDAEGDTLVDIEDVDGSRKNDTLIGDGKSNFLYGDKGNDNLQGADGDDYLSGGKGNDSLYGGSGDDWLYGWSGADHLDGGDGVDIADYDDSNAAVTVDLSTGTGAGGHAEGDTLVNIEDIEGSDYDDTLTGNSENNYIFGDLGDDVIRGGAGDDLLDGDAGNDSVYGEDGDDTLIGWSGVELLDGGSGSDTADYVLSTGAITVNLATGSASGGHAEGDTLVGIENVDGGAYNDVLIGDDQDNTLFGDYGSDTLEGGNGIDQLRGGEGIDFLNGGAGDDFLNGWTGADRLDGGAGEDEVGYEGSEAGVTINLETGTGSGGHAQGDTILNVENVAGSDHNDTLIGDASDNKLWGQSGNDNLQGGAGNDTLTGGLGGDSFVFGEGFGSDSITDFEDGTDTIQIETAGVSYADLQFTQSGVDVVIALGSHGSITLEDLSSSVLSESDFSFV